MTRQRRIIHGVIMQSCEHMTAEEIFVKAREIYPSIAVGTVYRNLGLMTQQNEIQRIAIPNAPDRYDKSPIPHEHMICECCGSLCDICVGDIKSILQRKLKSKILSYLLSIYHVCSSCEVNVS